jgi:hypothetical protein
MIKVSVESTFVLKRHAVIYSNHFAFPFKTLGVVLIATFGLRGSTFPNM